MVNRLLISKVGLVYEIYFHGLLLCSLPNMKLAFTCAREIASDLNLSSEIVYETSNTCNG